MAGSDALPPLLLAAFDGEAELLAWTLALPPSLRRELHQWIMSPVHEETRLRRADRMAEWLLSAMEAEKELPPFITQALAQTAHARKGWDAWPISHRRRWLFALFGARTLETRTLQLTRLVEAAAAKASR